MGSTIYRKVFTRSEVKKSDHFLPSLLRLGCAEGLGAGSKQWTASIQGADSPRLWCFPHPSSPRSHTHTIFVFKRQEFMHSVRSEVIIIYYH